jgi:hypothetical protein
MLSAAHFPTQSPRRNITALVKGPGNDRPVLVATDAYYIGGKSGVYLLPGVLLPDALPELRGTEVLSDIADKSGSGAGRVMAGTAHTLFVLLAVLLACWD